MSPSLATVARAIERRDIHLAACRARRQGLVCSACSDLAECADLAEAAAPSDQLVIRDGVVSWSRIAA